MPSASCTDCKELCNIVVVGSVHNLFGNCKGIVGVDTYIHTTT